MKIKLFFLVLLCLSVISAIILMPRQKATIHLALCSSATVPQSVIERLYDAAMKDITMWRKLRGTPLLVVAVFDAGDEDGIMKALVTFRDDLWQTDGHLWYDYHLKDGQWQMGQRKLDEENNIVPDNHVYAYEKDFYILSEYRQNPKLVTIHRTPLPVIHEITFDAEGYLKLIPMPDLALRQSYFSGMGSNPLASEYTGIIPRSVKDGIKPIRVLTFDPTASHSEQALQRAEEKASSEQGEVCPELDSLCELAWLETGALREQPQDPFISVLFFDIDHDGIPEALVTYKGNDYTGTGGGGHLWNFYRFKDGRWQTGPLKEVEGGVTDPNCVDSAGDGFFSLTREEGQKPTLVASSSFRGHDGNGNWSFSEDASEISIDSEGYLRVTPILELTTNYFGKTNWDENVIETDYKTPEISRKLAPVGVATFHPIGKTVVFKKRDDGWLDLAFTNNYVWQTPIREISNPAFVVTNTALLPTGLQDAIKNNPGNSWDPREPFLPDTVSAMLLDLKGDGISAFLVDIGRWDFTIGGQCYVIFGKTGETYSEMGHIRKDFTELALHKKTNGLHSLEFCYPISYPWREYYGVRSTTYVRDIYVFDGTRYHLAVRSWCKNDSER